MCRFHHHRHIMFPEPIYKPGILHINNGYSVFSVKISNTLKYYLIFLYFSSFTGSKCHCVGGSHGQQTAGICKMAEKCVVYLNNNV